MICTQKGFSYITVLLYDCSVQLLVCFFTVLLCRKSFISLNCWHCSVMSGLCYVTVMYVNITILLCHFLYCHRSVIMQLFNVSVLFCHYCDILYCYVMSLLCWVSIIVWLLFCYITVWLYYCSSSLLFISVTVLVCIYSVHSFILTLFYWGSHLLCQYFVLLLFCLVDVRFF